MARRAFKQPSAVIKQDVGSMLKYRPWRRKSKSIQWLPIQPQQSSRLSLVESLSDRLCTEKTKMFAPGLSSSGSGNSAPRTEAVQQSLKNTGCLNNLQNRCCPRHQAIQNRLSSHRLLHRRQGWGSLLMTNVCSQSRCC